MVALWVYGYDTADDDSGAVEVIGDSVTGENDIEGEERSEEYAENYDENGIHRYIEEEVSDSILETESIPDEL